ncbi:MAG: glycosyltransferase family 4 protein [Candidatus Andersenbacteria bacterium]
MSGLLGKFKRDAGRYGWSYALRRGIAYTFDPTRGHHELDWNYYGSIELTPERTSWNQRPLTRPTKKPSIAWIVSDMDIGSGGHTTLFRLAYYLERAGHPTTIYVHGKTKYGTPEEFRRVVREHFFPLEAHVIFGADKLEPCDVAVATTWFTAYPLYASDAPQRKAYLVQDYEPWFYPKSSEYLMIENTYRMGFYGICVGPWLAATLRQRFGMQTSHFLLAADDNYHEDPATEREAETVCAYVRPATPRRAFQFAVQALRHLKRMRPQTKVVLYGADLAGIPTPVEHESLGILTPKQLGALYRRSTVGLSLSLTNYSLIPQEMMACGLPVVELDGETTRAVFKDGQDLLLAPSDPVAVAKKLAQVLDDKALQDKLRAGGKKFVSDISWDKAGVAVARAIEQLSH